MKNLKPFAAAVFIIFITASAPGQKSGPAALSGELKQWHRVTLTFDGPNSGEDATLNPFRDYRLEVTFSREGRRLVVPAGCLRWLEPATAVSAVTVRTPEGPSCMRLMT